MTTSGNPQSKRLLRTIFRIDALHDLARSGDWEAAQLLFPLLRKDLAGGYIENSKYSEGISDDSASEVDRFINRLRQQIDGLAQIVVKHQPRKWLKSGQDGSIEDWFDAMLGAGMPSRAFKHTSGWLTLSLDADPSVMAHLIARGVVDRPDPYRYRLMMDIVARPCTEARLEIFEMLVKAGVEVNAVAPNGLTPLLSAVNEASRASRFWIDHLIRHGADPDDPGSSRRHGRLMHESLRPLDLALNKGDIWSARTLLDAGARVLIDGEPIVAPDRIESSECRALFCAHLAKAQARSIVQAFAPPDGKAGQS